jgi:class 3 adenylate cyclase
MTGIRDWLASIGLEKYAGLFEQAEIDRQTVPHLTESDLKELGLPLGPRRKLLSQPAMQGALQSRPAENRPPGERRHVTILFVDMVGSTKLSVSTDPEILAAILKTFKEAITAELARLGGTVIKFLGDGVLACFGWPEAKENAAEGAIRCGLNLIAEVQQLQTPGGHKLHCRVGVATGLVAIGEATNDIRDDSIAGESLNLASRLLSVAEPDSVAMDDRTRRLVAQLFDCHDLGTHRLDGFDQPVRAWRPSGPATEKDRFTATRQIKTGLIGRAQELAVLQSRWEEASSGNGNAVVIVGEAGIGKSRLCLALREQIQSRAHIFLPWQGSAYHQTNGLYPIIDYFLRAAEIDDADPQSLRLQKLSSLLARVQIAPQRALPLFADLLSIPPEAGYAAPELPPQQRKAALIAELGNAIGRLAEIGPALLLLEDAHWIDPTTLELMTRLIQTIAHTRMLVLITVRPDFASPWLGFPEVSMLGLRRLNDRQCEDLVREIDAAGDLQQSTVQQIVTKCDGNPLFVEEMSLAVLETRIANSPIPDAQHVPDTLQSSLMSRLDRLEEAKHTAQICAVLGRRFARPLLAAIAELNPLTLDSNLSLLVTRGIIHPLGRIGDGRYEFKHALLRDAAYNSLLLSHRRHLHESCAINLEQHFKDVAQSEPELLAYHFAQAGLAAKATDYAELAGDRAADRFAFSEAIASYREAIRNNTLTPEGVARERRALQLLLKLGPALGIINGPQDAETREIYQQAQTISAALGDTDNLFKSVWGLWYSANIGRDFDQAAGFAEKLVVLSDNSRDDSHMLEALHCRWSSGLFRGQFVAAGLDAERGTSLYDRGRHHRLALLFGGHDPGVCACGVRGWAQIATGHRQVGLATALSGVKLADELAHPHSLAHGLANHASAAAIARDWAAVEHSGIRLGELAVRFNFPPQQMVSRFLLAWVENQTGNAKTGLDQMVAEFSRTLAISPVGLLYTALHADALCKAGRLEEALAVINQSFQGIRQDVGIYVSELYRIRGNCLHLLGRTQEAKQDHRKSIAIADRQGARLLKLRTAATLLSIADGADHRDVARAELEKALRLIPADPTSPDLNEVQALL